MAKDAVVLSPEYNNVGRREAKSIGGSIQTGTVCKYVAGGVANAEAADNVAPLLALVAVQNQATHEDLIYAYAENENVFLQSLPRGCLCNLKAAAATYNAGDVLEVGAGGVVQAITTGQPFAIVPSFGGEVIQTGNSLMVELI